MKNLWFCLSFLFICSVALAGQKIIGALEVTGNATIDGGIYGDGSHLSGLFNGVNWPDIGGSQASVNVSGFTNDAGYLNSINWTAFPNSQGYITGVNWDQIAGLQSSVGNSGFTNDANYITQAEINWDAFTNNQGYISSVNWDAFPNTQGYITQSGINWTAFPNTQGYISSVNWSEATTTNTDGINWSVYNDKLDASALTPYAKLDGTNQPFTGNVSVTGTVTVNDVLTTTYGSGGDTVTDVAIGSDVWRVHKFSTLGAATFTRHDVTSANVLVVAGGGSGGVGNGGGGGAGGLLYTASVDLSSSPTWSITVGDGGAAASGTYAQGNNGSNSAFGSITTTGGGGGNTNNGGTSKNGGSGGGGAPNTAITGGTGVAGPPRQGYNGGNGNNGSPYGGGGGGGAGGAGTAANTMTGGIGVDMSLYFGTGYGVTGWFAGGGGGGSNSSGGSATSGGGAGTANGTAGAGTDNTGGGGGGKGYTSATSGKGGSGIVLVAYKVLLGTYPTVHLKGASTEKWAIGSDGNHSDNLTFYNASSSPKVTFGQSTGVVTATGFSATGGFVGARVAKTIGTVYQAATDGLITCTGSAAGASQLIAYTDSSNPPTTIYQESDSAAGGYASVMALVSKSDYYKCNFASGGGTGNAMAFRSIGN